MMKHRTNKSARRISRSFPKPRTGKRREYNSGGFEPRSGEMFIETVDQNNFTAPSGAECSAAHKWAYEVRWCGPVAINISSLRDQGGMNWTEAVLPNPPVSFQQPRSYVSILTRACVVLL